MTSFKIIDKRLPSPQDGTTVGISGVSEKERLIYVDNIAQSPENIYVFCSRLSGIYPAKPEIIDYCFFNNRKGVYFLKGECNKEEIKAASYYMGHGFYPYQIPREYEAARHLKKFKPELKGDDVLRDATLDLIKYTFGLEFETSMGFIPEEMCYASGLIPLRDGSITGTEYSTVVLSSNPDNQKTFDANLLQKQVKLLRDCCYFNKECALHMHLGGYPVTPKAIYILYLLEVQLEAAFYEGILPPLTFKTSRYKKNGKDYCMRLPEFFSFNDLYQFYVGKPYAGSLEQPHPADENREAKWHITGRYYGLNFINMLCYSGPKTVEFRFLRPTFNYRKIRLWLLIFNAILEYAESLYKKLGNLPDVEIYNQIRLGGINTSLYMILSLAYGEKMSEKLIDDINMLKVVVELQTVNGDTCGQLVDLEDKLYKDII